MYLRYNSFRKEILIGDFVSRGKNPCTYPKFPFSWTRYMSNTHSHTQTSTHIFTRTKVIRPLTEISRVV